MFGFIDITECVTDFTGYLPIEGNTLKIAARAYPTYFGHSFETISMEKTGPFSKYQFGYVDLGLYGNVIATNVHTYYTVDLVELMEIFELIDLIFAINEMFARADTASCYEYYLPTPAPAVLAQNKPRSLENYLAATASPAITTPRRSAMMTVIVGLLAPLKRNWHGRNSFAGNATAQTFTGHGKAVSTRY